jgi:2-oxoglutarate ferredoxin oxidoreductase subunit gamma
MPRLYGDKAANMQQHEIIFSGFGGQGALFAGQLLAYAALGEDKHVTWIPSYGPEMRGGTAHCIVIVSDEEIGAPIVRNPSAAVVLNNPSMDKYEALLKPGGVLVINRSLIVKPASRQDITVVEIPANDLATEVGSAKMANVVLLGALLETTRAVSLDSVSTALDEHLPAKARKLLSSNKQALYKGAEVARAQLK